MSTIEAVTIFPFGHRPTLIYNVNNIVEFFDELCMHTLFLHNELPIWGRPWLCSRLCRYVLYAFIKALSKFIVLYDDHHDDYLESLFKE